MAGGMSFFGYLVSARDRFIAGLPEDDRTAFAEQRQQLRRAVAPRRLNQPEARVDVGAGQLAIE